MTETKLRRREPMDTKPIRALIQAAKEHLNEALHWFVTDRLINEAVIAVERALADHERLQEAINSVPSGPPALTEGELEALRLADDLAAIALDCQLTKRSGPWPQEVQAKAREYRKARGLE